MTIEKQHDGDGCEKTKRVQSQLAVLEQNANRFRVLLKSGKRTIICVPPNEQE